MASFEVRSLQYEIFYPTSLNFLGRPSRQRIYVWRVVVGVSQPASPELLSEVCLSVRFKFKITNLWRFLIQPSPDQPTDHNISRISSPGRSQPQPLPLRLLLLSFIKPRNFLVQCRNIKTQNFSYLIFVKYKITNSLLVYADLATFCDRAANGWEKSKQTSLLGSRLVSDYNNDRIILVYRAAQL